MSYKKDIHLFYDLCWIGGFQFVEIKVIGKSIFIYWILEKKIGKV